MTTDRATLVSEFLDQYGWVNAKRTLLAGDASFRKYDRITSDKGSAVLMDAPPPYEDVRPFILLAKHLVGLGFSAPRIYAADEEAGLLLIEDLGDDTYTRLLYNGHDEYHLYKLATDALISLHQIPASKAIPSGVSTYNLDRLLEEVGRLHEWYMPSVVRGENNEAMILEFENIWKGILPAAWLAPTTLVLFDFHIDNLLGLLDREGVRKCGLLDFQDAVAGPCTYDLMSLLEDARRDVSDELVTTMKKHYLDAFPNLSLEAFETSWAVMAAQRHIRVIGTFARLKYRDDKPHYMAHIPRLWKYMDTCLEHPILLPLRDWLNLHLPADKRVIPS